MEGQVTSAEWLRERRSHSAASWEVKALFSDPATSITKGFVLAFRKLSQHPNGNSISPCGLWGGNGV